MVVLSSPLAVARVSGYSAPGKETKPNEDACSAFVDRKTGDVYAALMDGATDVSGKNFADADSPPRFYARHASRIAPAHIAGSDSLHEAARKTIENLDALSQTHGYIHDGMPRHAFPTAAGVLGHISVSEQTARFFMIADPSVIIKHPDGQIEKYDGRHETSHLRDAFFRAHYPDLLTEDQRLEWEQSATREKKLAKHQFVRDTGLNLAGGYPVFSTHPEAVEQSRYIEVSLGSGKTDIYLCSDGLMRPVNDYTDANGTPLWSAEELLHYLESDGPENTVARIRRLESQLDHGTRLKGSDDATVLHAQIELD